MPFTPFHFGAGAIAHAVAPRHVSFLAFCAANVVIDVEPLYWMLVGQPPVHRWAHSYLAATLVLLATTAVSAAASRLASATALPDALGWRWLTWRQVAIGAALGSYSHVVLDSVMHADL